MGYDFSFDYNTFYLTYNVSGMLYKANSDSIRCIYGKTARESIPLLKDMLNYFIDNKEELEKLNPENGFGSYDITLDVLFDALKIALKNIKDETTVWYGD